MRRDRRGFTLIEVVISGAVIALMLTTVVLIARQFLFNLVWSGETFSGIHESALIEGTLRRDLARTAVVGGKLAVEVREGGLSITLPAGASPGRIDYRLDPAAKSLTRAEDGKPGQALAVGLVAAFVVRQRWVVTRGGATRVVEQVSAGDRVQRAGLLVELTVKGQPVAGNAAAAQGVVLSTHIFPYFANLALTALWRRAGGTP